jgi:hypothetical protein
VTPLRLVAPFLRLPPQSDHHRALPAFDWLGAIRMMSDSAERCCGVPVQVITDSGADMPLPCVRYETSHRRLMLWVLEVSLRYLESDDFDRDTVALDCDQLIYQDLRPFFAVKADLGLLIRPTMKHRHTWKKLLNGVQFWAVAGKARLIPFYREALAKAEQMSDALIDWGADTAAVCELIEPVELGLIKRAGLTLNLMDYQRVLEALSEEQIKGLARGVTPRPMRAVLDFRYRRKAYMAEVYDLTIGAVRA